MATVRSRPKEERLLHLDGVDWRGYELVGRAFADRPAIRITYDRGALEIMITSYEHEGHGYILGRLVDALTDELGLPIAGGGRTTFKRRKKLRGLEPDNCYWIAHEADVRGKKRIDLRIDPPPDLAIEVDVTSSSINRMGIYAALGVPEVWRYDEPKLTFHVLGSDGKYGPDGPSATFPGLIATAVVPFLALRGQMDENALVRRFREWIRQQIGAGGLKRQNQAYTG